MKTRFKITYLLTAFVLGLLFSCGVSGPKASAVKKYRNVLILGNSITRHGPKPEIGWKGDWGMAASSKDKDYVHLLMAKFHAVDPAISVQFKNIADYERNYWTYDLSQLEDLRKLKPELIILRLGENVDPKGLKTNDFKKYYEGLIVYLTSANPKAKVLNAASFWKRETVVREIQAVSDARGNRFLNLSELSADSTNMAFKEFANKGVGAHPSDKGMKAIAEKIWMEINKPGF